MMSRRRELVSVIAIMSGSPVLPLLLRTRRLRLDPAWLAMRCVFDARAATASTTWR